MVSTASSLQEQTLQGALAQVESERDLLQAMLEQSADGVIVVDAQGVVRIFNPAAQAQHGVPLQEVGVPEWTERYGLLTLEGEPMPAEQAPLYRALQGERVVNAHWKVCRPDGSVRVLTGSATPLRNRDGSLAGALLISRDETERYTLQLENLRLMREAQEARAALAEALRREQEARALVEHERGRLLHLLLEAPAVIALLDGPEHVFRFCNVRFRQLMGGRDFTGLPIRRALPEVEGQGYFELLDGVYQTGRPFIGNEMPATFDREGTGRMEEGFFTFIYQPVTGPDGRVESVMVLGHEVTDLVRARRRAEELAAQLSREKDEVAILNATLERRVVERTAELQETNRELESFSYSVSHDLRAPLRHITGFAEMLERQAGPALDATGQRYLRTIAEAARRAGQLVDDLLAFSRMGRAELRQAEVPLEQLFEEARRELAGEAQGRTIRWEVGPLPTVRADPAMLRQVVHNLLGNAVKYTRSRPEAVIEVGAEVRPHEVEVFIRDNGVGFDMQYVHKLFGVFQRLHPAEEFEGTGIGLANVRRIIQRHGGRVTAEGAVDRGATFRFTLPRIDP